MPELARYDTNALMLEYRAEIYAALAAKLETGTTAQWMKALLAYDVWCAPVQTYDDLAKDPQAIHNQMFWEVPIGDGTATFRTPGSPFVFSATPAALHRGVPDLGEHTGQVLEDGE
jgi:crotonobetainyl-CoA:carnitine CoA-transferase CaiB-like acyl-CoA transferase